MLEDWPSIVGTIPGWITSTGVLAILGLVVRWQLGLKKLRIEADQVEISAKVARGTDEADIRDHYADEVRQLREQLNGQGQRHREEIHAVEGRYKDALRDAEDRHEKCIKDRELLRDQVIALKDLAAGLQRIITQASASQAIRIAGTPAGEVPDDIVKAARRVEQLFAPEPEPEQPAE